MLEQAEEYSKAMRQHADEQNEAMWKCFASAYSADTCSYLGKFRDARAYSEKALPLWNASAALVRGAGRRFCPSDRAAHRVLTIQGPVKFAQGHRALAAASFAPAMQKEPKPDDATLHVETKIPAYADDHNFYKVEKWTHDGTKVDRLLYAGNSLAKAQQIFARSITHRPRIRLTIRQRTRLLQQWPA